MNVRQTVAIAAMAGTTAYAVDGTLPSIPEVSSELSTDIGIAQLTVSLYLFGYALGQIPMGFAADMLGRRRVVLTCLALLVFAGLLASISQSIEMLIACRLFQGFCGASGAVVSRAIVRDVTEGKATVRLMSFLSSVLGFTMIVAPLIGSVLLILAGWRFTFAATGLLGATAFVLTWAFIPETNRSARSATVFLTFKNSLLAFAGSRSSITGTILMCLTISGLFAFVTLSSELFIRDFGFSEYAYALTFSFAAAGYLLGGLVSRLLGNTIEVRNLIHRCAGGYVLSAILLALYWVLLPELAVLLIIGLFAYLVCVGSMLGLGNALTLEEMPQSAGMTAGLLGTFSFATGSLHSILLTRSSVQSLTGLLGTLIGVAFLILIVSLTIRTTRT